MTRNDLIDKIHDIEFETNSDSLVAIAIELMNFLPGLKTLVDGIQSSPTDFWDNLDYPYQYFRRFHPDVDFILAHVNSVLHGTPFCQVGPDSLGIDGYAHNIVASAWIAILRLEEDKRTNPEEWGE